MHFKFFQLATLLLLSCHVCYSQKYPDIQDVSVSAPLSIKADGKNQEWDDTFQAFNKRTGIQYTIANDQENLYFAIKSEDATTSNKIIAGGIELSINPDGKKKEKEGFKVIYPLVKRSSSRLGSSNSSSRGMGFSTRAEQTAKQRDSMMTAMRKAQLAQVKEIKIHGFSIPDTLISIYNEYRLKAFSSFDEKGAFFYELAIPLKLMGLSVQTAGELAYNIKLRGLQLDFSRNGGGGGNIRVGGDRQSATFRSSGGSFGGGGGMDIQSLMSPTDFWGSYKLAK